MCVGAWSLISEREDMSKMECLVVSANTRLNGYGFDWSGRVTWQRTGRLIFSDWTGSFVAVLVRKVSGLHIKKGQSCLEMGEQVGGN